MNGYEKPRIIEESSVRSGLESWLDIIIKRDPGRFGPIVEDSVRDMVVHECQNPGKPKIYSNLRSINMWILYTRTKDWQDLTPCEFNDGDSEKKTFYNQLRRWAMCRIPGRTREDKQRRRNLMKRIISSRQYDFSYLQSIDDCVRMKNTNPEWKDASPRQMMRNEVAGGYTFYVKCRDLVKKLSRSERQRKEYMRQIFPLKQYFHEHPHTSISAWREAYEQNPEWCGKKVSELEKNAGSEGRIFITHLRRWLDEQYPGDLNKKKKAMRKIFKNYCSKR